ncbi:MAG: AzlD domain-containing protein [Candidatus Dormibacteria bacterium]
MSAWAPVLMGSLGCYLVKLAGLSVPPRFLRDHRLRAVTDLLPVALLSALVAIQAFTLAHRLVVDARAAGLAVGAIALLARAPFLVVVGLAAITTALLRLALHW